MSTKKSAPKTNIGRLLAKHDLNDVFAQTNIATTRLAEMAAGETPDAAVTTIEAVKLGAFFSISPKQILDAQTDEQLAAVGYEPEVKKAPEPRVGSKSPAYVRPQKREFQGSSKF